MIIAVGSDKGSPGATTLAMLLAALWPGDQVMCELDPRGADLPYRLPSATGGPLLASPSLTTLAVDARPGGPTRPLELYAQDTALGVPVIAGEVSVARFTKLIPALPAVAGALSAWPGTVLADVGCLQPWNPTLGLCRTAAAVVLVSRADTESLGRVRERVPELVGELGGDGARCPVGLVVRGAPRDCEPAVQRVRRLLDSVGCPAPVWGSVPDDPVAAAELWAGRLSRRRLRSGLVAAGTAVRDALSSRLAAPVPAATGLPVAADGLLAGEVA